MAESFIRTVAASGGKSYSPATPVRRVVKQTGKKTVKHLPMFPGYVFFNGDQETRYIARRSPATLKILDVTNQAQLHRELVQIDLNRPRDPVVEGVAELTRGRRCTVRAGHSMQGQEAWIDQVTGKGVVMCNVTILGASRPMSIDPEFLEPLD